MKAIVPRPCKYCDTSNHIEIQKLWQDHLSVIGVIRCRGGCHCEAKPFTCSSWHTHDEFVAAAYGAWNSDNSTQREHDAEVRASVFAGLKFVELSVISEDEIWVHNLNEFFNLRVEPLDEEDTEI